MSKAPKQKKAQLHYAPYQSSSVSCPLLTCIVVECPRAWACRELGGDGALSPRSLVFGRALSPY